MIVFKPRLAAFYVILFVTIALLSSRVTVRPQAASAIETNQTMGDNLH